MSGGIEFLAPDANGDAIARSPMERQALAAGATIELRDGWNVASTFDGEQSRLTDSVGFADLSHLGKLELNGPFEELAPVPLEFGLAARAEGAWWCPIARNRALLICEPGAIAGYRERFGARAIEMTTSYAALTIAGPQAREVFARFCALDLRPQSAPERAFRPGSVARTPGYVLREDCDRFLMLFGWALGRYVWEQVADAAGLLGGGPVGVDALAPLEEELAHA